MGANFIQFCPVLFKWFFVIYFWVTSPFVDGSTPIGTVIGRVIATDQDNAPFNILSYRLTGDGSAPVFFDVDTSGNIIVKSSLSADTTSEYTLRVVVSDSGGPAKTATTTATVRLTKNR